MSDLPDPADPAPAADHSPAEDAVAPARKRPKPGERRVQILQALASMLEQPGADRITTAALAGKLSVSEAALYRHFASKAQMFEGLIEFIESSIFTLINQISEREPDAQQQARRITHVLLQFGEKNPGMTRVMVGDALVFENERLIARMNQFFDRVESQLRQCLRGVARYRRRQGAAVLEPVKHVAGIRLSDLKEIDGQRDRLLRNTAQFVAGSPANNVLLTGARGTGKSSLIKACLNEFAAQGLRLIEVDKAELTDLPDIADLVAERPERFIIFCDDLSFEEGEAGYKALKSMLDGTVAASSDNVLIYATSNRRHLLPEKMKDNLGASYTDEGELHPGEAVEEKISLSERFGLWISFYPFSQDEYLAIVAQWLQHLGMTEADIQAARPEALIFALEHGATHRD
ncbi:MAG: nucleoid occlusion factor SlmA [Ideonella sp. MAG2]|nr:MAG: nucleoid occlusion factor SlmA [Ideonella sp. MAG2]